MRVAERGMFERSEKLLWNIPTARARGRSKWREWTAKVGSRAIDTQISEFLDRSLKSKLSQQSRFSERHVHKLMHSSFCIISHPYTQ